jgi:hypothetical protein
MRSVTNATTCEELDLGVGNEGSVSGVDGPDVLDVCGRIGEDIKGCQLLAEHPGVVLGMVVEIDMVARSLSIASGDGVLRHVHGLAVEHLAPIRSEWNS